MKIITNKSRNQIDINGTLLNPGGVITITDIEMNEDIQKRINSYLSIGFIFVEEAKEDIAQETVVEDTEVIEEPVVEEKPKKRKSRKKGE